MKAQPFQTSSSSFASEFNFSRAIASHPGFQEKELDSSPNQAAIAAFLAAPSMSGGGPGSGRHSGFSNAPIDKVPLYNEVANPVKKKVDISSLVPTQQEGEITKKTVDAYINKAKGYNESIQVTPYKGKLAIIDGHHRAIAAIARGEKQISVEEFPSDISSVGPGSGRHKENNGTGPHGKDKKRWVGFDLDGTLAHYDKYRGMTHIGKPIQPIVDLVKKHLASGQQVKIFTARASHPGAVKAVKAWCKKNIGQELEVTNVKDHHMETLYDDRAKQVTKNKGIVHATAIGEQVAKNLDKMLLASDDDSDGVWRTIHGQHIFIRDGETAKQAWNRRLKEDKTKAKNANKNAKSLNSKDVALAVKKILAYYTKHNPKLINYDYKQVRNWVKPFKSNNEHLTPQDIAKGKGVYPELFAHFGLGPNDLYKTMSTLNDWTDKSSNKLRSTFATVVNTDKGDLGLVLEKELTKQKLDALNPSGYMTLYRGMAGSRIADLKALAGQANFKYKLDAFKADSWTSIKKIADSFSKQGKGIVITHNISNSEVLSSQKTNPFVFKAHSEEKEFIVVPNKGSYKLNNKTSKIEGTSADIQKLVARLKAGKILGLTLRGDTIYIDPTKFNTEWLHKKSKVVTATAELKKNLKKLIAGGPGSGRHPYGRKPKPVDLQHHSKEAKLAIRREAERTARQELNKQGLSQRGQPIVSDKAKRALASANVATKEQQDIAESTEKKVLEALGGTKSHNNSPFDVTVKVGNKNIGIEVKALINQKNDKITQKGDAIARKQAYAANNGIKPSGMYTVAVDWRNSRTNPDVYIRNSVGSFRLANMDKVSGGFKGLSKYFGV